MSVTQQQPSPKQAIGETVFDDSDLRRYRTELPNIIDDLDLSLCAYRLYGHYKRVAGSGGVCFQSNRTIAAACKMSVGSVVNARKELAAEREELGGASLITVTKRGTAGSEHVNVRIVDIWEYNMRRYAVRSDRSPDEGGCSPHEQGVQNVITKKELKLRTNPEKKKKDLNSLLLAGKGNFSLSLQSEDHGTEREDQIEEHGIKDQEHTKAVSALNNVDAHQFVWGDKRLSIGEAMEAYSQHTDECYSAPWYWLVSEVERLRNGTIKLSDFDRFVAKEWAGIEQAKASLTIKEKIA